MAGDEKKLVTEVKASLTGAHISPRKARLVADLLKHKQVAEALDILKFLTKKAAHPIRKLVDSGVANALHNFQIESERLFIKHLSVDGGPVMKRYQPRAQGRAFPIRKRTSHINLILGVSDKPIAKKAVKTLAKGEPIKELGTTKSMEPEAVEKKSRFSFWRKKTPDTTQVPPKVDVKGKHYTGFDRRGNMGT